MNIFFGLFFLSVAIGLGIMIVMMGIDMKDEDPLFLIAGAAICIPLVLALFALGAVFIFSPESMEEKLLEGACYRAYGKDTIVPVGKVFVPIHDVVLVEIRCP